MERTKIISQTKNGCVFVCDNCNQIHFEYKNINVNFETKEEYRNFGRYFLRLNGEYWEKRNPESFFRRKIFVPIADQNLHIVLNRKELNELKVLFFNVSIDKDDNCKTAHFIFNEN